MRGRNGSGRGKRRVLLGEEKFRAFRDQGSSYDARGKFISGTWVEYELNANLQGALIWNRLKMLDSGEEMKQCLSLRTHQAMQPARIGANGEMLQADRLLYQDALWEVRDLIQYRNLNLTKHDEVLLVRLDESPSTIVPIGGCCD